MESPTELRSRAERYRQIALTVTDRRTIEALRELAVLYEAEADRLEADQKQTPAC
jgi:flagellar biosynthesis regulator FlbT